MVDGNKIIITFYFIYCVCAYYKCCIMPYRGPDLENKVSCILYLVYNECSGVKPLIHQSELRTYESSPFSRKKFLSHCSIVKTTEWNGLIKIDN